ncbi:MAG: NTP transferase domain-containing protein [Elusimicrobia bacterium]|nr:NTP transferase domain-containing protein [Elusimicrobiota bacterium]
MTERRIRHALIMAAGRGQRMMPLTATMPKAMAPYLNSTLIAHGIARVREHIEHVHVTVGYKGAMLAHHLVQQRVDTIFNTEGRSNSWWIHHTLLRELDEPIFVLTADNVTDLDFGLLEQDHVALGAPAGMLVPVRPIAGLEGDFISHDSGRVTRISRTDPTDIYCSGIQVLNPARVGALTAPGGDFYAVWDQLIAVRQLWVSSVYPKRWITVDTVDDLAKLGMEGIGSS